MPDDILRKKRRLEESFWSLLLRRYPLTWWWWNSEREEKLVLFPEWSSAAFEREAIDWRRLAQETVDVPDEEVQHWGRFARWTATRILSGSYQDGADPLRHANTAMSLVQLLDPLMERYPPEELLDGLAGWLDEVSGVGSANFWRHVRTESESSHLLRQLAPFDRLGDAGLSARYLRATAAVKHYVTSVLNHQDAQSEAIPWTASAHMFVETWRALRQAMSHEQPYVMGPPSGVGDAVLAPSGHFVNFPELQEVVVPGLKQWWVRPASDRDIIYHGARRDPSLPLAVSLALWYQQSRKGRLTWALTHPPYVEGGLEALANLLPTLWPGWAPVQTGMLAQWAQRRRALAVVDAWLWLEAGDPPEALNWLARFVPRSEAVSVIPWIKSHPGYYVTAYRACEVLLRVKDSSSWQHWMFNHGPVMPPDLFA